MEPSSRPLRRPDSVTAVSAILLALTAVGIVLGALGLYNFLTDSDYAGDPKPIAAMVFPFLAGIPGWFMLRGQSWARKFYWATFVPAMVLGDLVTFSPNPRTILRFVAVLFVLIISCITLSTQPAGRYFNRGRAPAHKLKKGSKAEKETFKRFDY